MKGKRRWKDRKEKWSRQTAVQMTSNRLRQCVRAMVGALLLVGLFGVSCSEPGTVSREAPYPAPYPASAVVASVTWDFGNRVRRAPGSDLWPTTWAADGNIYSSWGDGGGFGGTNRDGRVSLGFARIEGFPDNVEGYNVWGGKNPENVAGFGGKCAGMLSVDGILYGWINTQNGFPPDYKLAWSSDLGATWELSTWVFPKTGTFFPSTFLNFGQDYAGARDRYVYSYGANWTEAEGRGPENNLYSVRVLREKITDRTAYEFFMGLDSNGKPIWTSDIDQREPAFTDPNGVGNPGLANVVFNPGIARYLLTVGHRPPNNEKYLSGRVGRLGIFDAPEPWGPWTTVAYYDNWGGFGDDGFTLGYHFPTKWISPGGKTLWMIFSSTGVLDSFNLIKGTLTLKTPTDPDEG